MTPEEKRDFELKLKEGLLDYENLLAVPWWIEEQKQEVDGTEQSDDRNKEIGSHPK
ncbi:hypothetical protein HDV05_008670, partial [Chytridiales sp. JEL 0842]